MKILYFTSKDPYSNERRGAQLATLELIKEFNNNSFESGLAAHFHEKPMRKGEYRLKLPKSKITRKLLLDYFNPIVEKEMFRILKDYKPDLIHFNSLIGFPIHTINKIAKICPVVITIRDTWIIKYSDKLPEVVNILHARIVLNKINNTFLIAPSKFIYNKLVSAGSKKVKLIYDCVDMLSERTSYEKTILYCGGISPEKGLQTIIGILDKIHNYRTLVLGEGPMKKNLQEAYRNITFLGYQDPMKYYQKSSILIMPSICEEVFGRSTAEAMSCGLCVIGTNIGGTPELIKPYETGLLFEPGNADDFEQKLIYLLDNPEKIQSMGRAASNFIKKKYSYKEMMQNYKEAYQETMRQFRPIRNNEICGVE